jgi:hypothetical protein
MKLFVKSVLLSILSLAAAIATPHADSHLVQLEPRANPVPDCSVNGGTALCCQGTFAGDLPIVVTLAGFSPLIKLNPNDVNCIGSELRCAACWTPPSDRDP